MLRSRNLVARVLSVVLVTATCTAASDVADLRLANAAVPIPAVVSLRSELERLTGNSAEFAVRPSTGNVTFIGSRAGQPLTSASDDDLTAIARRFVDRYASLYGIADATNDLTESNVFTGPTGSAVRFRQDVKGIPVLAGQIALQIDLNGAVVSSTGETSADLDVEVTPTTTAQTAAATALALTERRDGTSTDVLTASTPVLLIYDPTLIGADDPEGARLVWRVEVRTEIGDVDRLVLIDAQSGAIALDFSTVDNAKQREVCDNNNDVALSATCTSPVLTETSGTYGTSTAAVRMAYDLSGLTYDFFLTNFGRDSLDGIGLPLKSTVNYCQSGSTCPYKNAYWSGTEMVYGQGYERADDVVGHELTHGLTDFTSKLLYFAESGAINESMSDVMGEIIDQSSTVSGPDAPADAWLMGEQLPAAIRNMADPTAFGDPDRMTSSLYFAGLTDNRGVHRNSGVNNKAAYLIAHGDTFNGQTITGIGNIKTAKIYYQAETTLLGPGSDYFDLSSILPQACTNLIGAGTGITVGDCQQVSKAVTATEMATRPTKPGASMTAPLCAAGVRNSIRFSDDMETNTANWASSTTGAGTAWRYFAGSSQSGSRSVHVDDVGNIGTSTLTGQIPVAIPAATTTYVRFDHTFHTDADPLLNVLYDGGVVEYTTDGATWNDLMGLPAVNGYGPGTSYSLAIDNGYSNPLGTRYAFGTVSPSYITTRVDLSSLAGQSVRFRFVFGTDSAIAYPGWWIDDVSVYTCGAPAVPAAPTLATATAGNGSASLVWNAPSFDGGAAISSYTVTTYIGGAAQTPIVTSTATTAAIVPGLIAGTTYTFTVAANNSAGTGSASGQSNSVVPFGQPSAPTIVSAVAANGAVRLAWTSPTFDGLRPITGYVITPFIGGIAQTTKTVGAVTQSTVSGLTNGTTYRFTVAAVNETGIGAASAISAEVVPLIAFSPLIPARLVDTRPGQPTVDGEFSGIGLRAANSVTAVLVAGRGGVAANAVSVVLNVTVTEAQDNGYLTAYPCGGDPPTASNLNYVAGGTVPNAVIVKVGDGGQVCFFTQAAVHLIVDVGGYFPTASSLVSLVPARLFESRPGLSTVDGAFNGEGPRPAGSVTEIQILGRDDVPGDASAVALNVTVTNASAAGFATVYPCGQEPPAASSLNYDIGGTVPNAVVGKIGTNGRVCVFTQSRIDLIVDVNGYFPSGSTLVPLVPARLLETRPGHETVDGQLNGIGQRVAGSITQVPVIGRGGVAADAVAVVLNVTITEPQAAGYATVYPCGGVPPTASNLNYGAGDTIANAVMASVGEGGAVCVYTQSATNLIVDVNGDFAG